MDGIPSIVFQFNSVKIERPYDGSPWPFILGITGQFEICIGENVLYSEEEFCLVEFAVDISEWLLSSSCPDGDFEYESTESSEYGLINIRRSNCKWKLGSIHQLYDEWRAFKLIDIRSATQSYIHRLCSTLDESYSIDLPAILRKNHIKLLGYVE